MKKIFQLYCVAILTLSTVSCQRTESKKMVEEKEVIEISFPQDSVGFMQMMTVQSTASYWYLKKLEETWEIHGEENVTYPEDPKEETALYETGFGFQLIKIKATSVFVVDDDRCNWNTDLIDIWRKGMRDQYVVENIGCEVESDFRPKTIEKYSDGSYRLISETGEEVKFTLTDGKY